MGRKFRAELQAKGVSKQMIKLQFGRFTSATLLFLLGSALVHAQGQDYKEEWQKFLSNVAMLENASLFIDVDTRKKPSHPRFSEQRGLDTIERLSTLLSRGMQQTGGTYVLYRSLDPGDKRSLSSHALALSWLQNISLSDRESLTSSSGLLYSNIDASEKDVLRHIIRRLSGGTGDIMLDEHEKDLRLAASFSPYIEFTNPENGELVKIPVVRQYPELDLLENGSTKSSPTDRVIRPIARPTDGDLDFGQGEIRTLAELFKLGSDKWGLTFWYDGRLSDTSYFLSGSFTKNRFMECIEITTRTVETKEANDPFLSLSNDVMMDLIDEFFEDRSQVVDGTQMTISDFTSGINSTLFDVFGPNPGSLVASMLERYGISGDHRVRLKPGIVLSFLAPGRTRIEDSTDGTQQYKINNFGLAIRGN